MFLYFLPGQTAHVGSVEQIPEPAAKAGLSAVLGGAGIGCRGGSGPGGEAGMMVWSAACEPTMTRFDADSQRWEQAFDASGAVAYWAGLPRSVQPCPQQLARSSMIEGNSASPAVRLLDGGDWVVPCMGFAVDGNAVMTKLPTVYRLAAGKREKTVRREWRELFVEASNAARMVYEGADWSVDEAYRYCARVLGVNYRVGPVECAMMELIGDAELWSIIRHSVGKPDAEAAMARMDGDAKKNAAAPSGG